MIHKLRGTCYAARSMVVISNINTLKSIYYAYFHSFMKYGIILGGKSSKSGKFSLYKKKRIMACAQPRTSCRSLFKEFVILPVPCHYILSLIKIIINNQENMKHIHVYTVLIQGIGTISKIKCQSTLFSKKYIMCYHKYFNLYHIV